MLCEILALDVYSESHGALKIHVLMLISMLQIIIFSFYQHTMNFMPNMGMLEMCESMPECHLSLAKCEQKTAVSALCQRCSHYTNIYVHDYSECHC